MTKRLRRRFVPLLAVIAVALAGCGDDSGGSSTTPDGTNAGTSDEQSTTVRLAYFPNLTHAPAIVGVEKGLFAEKLGANKLETKIVNAGPDAVTAILAGAIDASYIGPNPAINAFAQSNGAAIRIVSGATSAGAFLVVKPEINSIADLKGKKVAVNALGAATEFWLERALNAGGLTIKDVELLAIPFQNIPQALDSGAIAGAMLGEPFATLGARQGQVRVLNDSFLDGDQPTAVYYNAAWAEKHPRLAQGFMTAYLKSVRELESGGWSDATTLGILSKYTNVPAETIAAASRPFGESDGAVNLTSLQNQQTFFKQQGRLTYEQPLDIGALIEPRYAQEVVKQLGAFKPR